MKVTIETDASIQEDEVIIRCRSMTEEILSLHRLIDSSCITTRQMSFYKGDTEYYLPLSSILFFETDSGSVMAHTGKDIYLVKHKLYELEEILPGYFMRISKSTILNAHKVYAITRNLTASSTVEFEGTHKQVYVSRYYFKPLSEKLKEMRSHL